MQDLVLIPGLLCTAELYAPQLPALTRLARVHHADHSVAASMPDIAAHILAAAPPTFALAGLSMGGYIAFEIMRQAPARVTRLALLDTSARADTLERAEQRRGVVAAAEAAGLRSVAPSILPMMLHPAHQTDPSLLAILERMTLETGVTHFARMQSAIATRPDSRPLLASIRIPALVLCGRQDMATPLALSEEIAAGISGSRLVVIEDCGHLTTLEKPAAVASALSQWLEV